MTFYDDPNREAVGLAPIYSGTGDNVVGTLTLVATGLTVDATLAGGISDTEYTFGWGDGASDTVTSDGTGGAAGSHTYAAAGMKTVTVTRDDGMSGSETVMVSAPGFDPGEHTVTEVQDYVTAHPDETADVLAAEQAGKNRATLVTWLEG